MDITIFQYILWLVILILSIFALVRGADVFVEGAKHVGASLGMTPFATGVIIAGFGTSFPELASSIAAVLQGSTEIVIANVVGSNITNILLVVGLVVILSGRIIIKRDLIKSELPIFFIATVQFIAVAYDGIIDHVEALLLVGTFAAYVWYLFSEAESTDNVDLQKERGRRPRLEAKNIAFVVFGLTAVVVGANYSIEMVINIAGGFNLPIGLVSITAIALGTSLPELFVSIRAAREGHGELAIGTIFGSNAFNVLLVIGIPALISSSVTGTPLIADVVVMNLGLGVMIAASLIFFVNGLARQVMRWEGLMMVIFFCYFLVKLFSFI